MELNKMIESLDKSGCILKECKPYLENDNWYVSLLYEYKDYENKKHRVMFPKVDLPFNQAIIPTITRIPAVTMLTRDEVLVYKASDEMMDFKNKKVKFEHALWCDIIEEPKEMTMDEIEKALGYKVKIVNKEN